MILEDVGARLKADLVRLGNCSDVAGASAVVASGGQVVECTFGVTNARTRVPVTADTLFQIQSITKVFTATLVMQLIDEGLVHLDQPVQSYLPEFCTADAEASERITVRHLLTHTGGFEGDLWAPTSSGPDALDRFVRDLVTQAPQHSRPGQRFSYCNAGFGTLGRLVEVMREATYEDALRHHLADPLGIDELAFSADQALAFRTAIGHVRFTPSSPLRPTKQWALVPPSNPAAGNQLAMSARGLLELGRLFLAKGVAPSGARLLSEESVALMLQPQVQQRGAVPAPAFQGLGWRLPRPGIAEHGGGMPGVASMLQIVPEHDLAAVVLTNADAGSVLARQLLDPLFADLADVPPTPTLTTPDEAERVADPRPLLGTYSNRQSVLELTRDAKGRLWLTDQPQNESVTIARLAGVETVVEKHEIRPLTPDTFAVISNDNGQATRTVSFIDTDEQGLHRYLASDRVAPRHEKPRP